jgi:hypothetical protein
LVCENPRIGSAPSGAKALATRRICLEIAASFVRTVSAVNFIYRQEIRKESAQIQQ